MISYFGLGLHPLSAHPLSFSSVARYTAVPRSVTLLYSPATATLQLQLQPCACLCRAPASRLGLQGHRTGFNCGCGDGAVEGRPPPPHSLGVLCVAATVEVQ